MIVNLTPFEEWKIITILSCFLMFLAFCGLCACLLFLLRKRDEQINKSIKEWVNSIKADL